MFIKRNTVLFAMSIALFTYPSSISAMGGKPEVNNAAETPQSMIITESETTSPTPKELAKIFWPDSNATQLQQEEALKNLLGKNVTWEIVVAEIQRNGNGYLVQGQSDKDMIGTFSYIVPRNKEENEAIINTSAGSKLNISGVVNDMQMRHIVLKPAFIKLNK